MIIPLLILTAVHVHAGSNPGSKGSSPNGTPRFAPVTAHVPFQDDLNLGPAFIPIQEPSSSINKAKVCALLVAAVNKNDGPSGHMNFGRLTPQGHELPKD